MSLFNSVLGTLSPKLRDSFEDPRAKQQHELPFYRSSSQPRIPPPIASTVLWSAPATNLSPPPRIPDDLLAIQRRARHLEQQLQELLDAQADGLMGGLAANSAIPDDVLSNGSTTPTVSSTRGTDRSTENEDSTQAPRRTKVGLNTARRRIFRRIQRLAGVKAEELDLLDDDLRDLQTLVQKTGAWSQKRAKLEKRIKDIEAESTGTKASALQAEASNLEQLIRQKEEELWALRTRHRRVLNDLSDTENSVEAKLSTYKTSLSILDKEVAGFLASPPDTNHVPLSSSPFLSLPPKRRTLDMAHEYWADEHTRLTEKCEEVDIDRAALDEGAVLWNDVVKRVVDFEARLQDYMQQAGRDLSTLLEEMAATVAFLEEQVEIATHRGWNLLVCAIGAELEAFRQGTEVLEEALGARRKGKGKGKENAVESLVDAESELEDVSTSAIRIGRSPPKAAQPPKHNIFDTDDDDPDPELMISHQDTDTD